jgi:WD40 repeat protein
MQLQITCPDCGKINTLDAKQRGKRIRCADCGKLLETPAKENARSEDDTEKGSAGKAQGQDEHSTHAADKTKKRPRLRDDDDDHYDHDPQPRRAKNKSEGGTFPKSLLVVLSVLLVGGVGFAAWRIMRKTPQQVAVAPAADSTPNPEQPKPDVNPTPDTPKQDGVTPKDRPRKPKEPKEPKLPKPAAPQSDIPWTASADALPAPFEIPADTKGTIAIGGTQFSILYPSTTSPFICVTQKGPRGEVREVWDLRSLKKTGTVEAGNLAGAAALSPDGAYLAGQDRVSGDPIHVWSVADGKLVTRIPVTEPFPMDADIDFAGPGKLLIGLTSNQESTYRVIDLQTKMELRRFQVDGHTQRAKRAISSGGKYLALCSKKKDRVLVYDTTTGELAGEAMLPEKSFFDIEAVAFSPDGNSLSALHEHNVNTRVVVWNMNTGKMTGDHKLAKDLRSVAQHGAFYPGPAMEWLSDSSGWFCYGALLVDEKGAALYWTVPAGPKEMMQRRLFGLERVTRIVTNAQGKILRLEKLPADQVAAALKAVHPAGDGEGDRPALTAPDWSAANKLTVSAASSWQAKPDPLTLNGKLTSKPITLTGKSADLARIMFSGPAVSQAVSLSTPLANELSTKRTIKSDRYDLTTGKHLGTLDLFSFEPPKGPLPNIDGDLSPDGSLLMVKGPRGKRLDLWSVTDGKYLCGFTPLDRGSPNVIQYAAFVDEKRVLTLAGKRLILWDVPSCKVVWYVLGVTGPPALSPGHKHVVACVESAYHLLDVASGERLGTLAGPGFIGVGVSAFRSDGKQFAAICSTVEKKNVLMRWDTTSGAVLSSSPTSLWPGEMTWVGESHLLVGPVLFDMDLGWPVVSYNVGTGRHASGSPDGRHWYASATDAKKSAVLAAQMLPDAAAKDIARSVADKTAQAVMMPGTKLTLQANVAIPGEKDTQRLGEQALTFRMQGQGFSVGPGGPVTLSVQFQGPRATGETRQYENADGGKQKMVFTVPVESLDGVATLRDAQGVIWEKRTTFTTPDTIGTIETDNLQATLTKMLWDSAAQFVVHLEVPAVVLRGPGGIQVLPRQVALSDR